MSSISSYKKIIKNVFWLTIALILFLTIQAINETENWKIFDVDFNSRHHIISAYGSLIGGILAFLSILFVLYQVYEQREQIILEKKDFKNANLKDLNDRLLLLANYIMSLEKDIKKQGKRMELFYKNEKKFPSKVNFMHFSPNKNFDRVIEMDILSNFKAFQYFFKKDKESWQKQFVNLYEITDFYNESFKELKNKNSLHIEDKVSKQKQISADVLELTNSCSRLVDDYLIKFGKDQYLNKPWPELTNYLAHDYNKYLKNIKNDGEFPDFRHISDELLKPFLVKGMQIRRDEGFDDLGSREIIELASNLRKRIWLIEEYSLQYADSIEKHFNKYFNLENDTFKRLVTIKESIISKTNNF